MTSRPCGLVSAADLPSSPETDCCFWGQKEVCGCLGKKNHLPSSSTKPVKAKECLPALLWVNKDQKFCVTCSGWIKISSVSPVVCSGPFMLLGTANKPWLVLRRAAGKWNKWAPRGRAGRRSCMLFIVGSKPGSFSLLRSLFGSFLEVLTCQ